MPLIFTSPLVPALIALVPAGVVWWRGRRVSRLLDDPALPERLLAGRQVHGVAIGFSGALLLVAWSDTAWWTLPLLVLSRIAAAYPARRALFQETWSLGGYLSFFLRIALAVFGFWMLLSATPALIGAAGGYRWAAAGALAVVLVAWNERYADVFRRVLRATAIDDPALTSRFARIVEASGVAAPRFDRVEMRGGVFANAVALPSLRGSAVVFTGTLTTQLDADAVAAIAAHEIAHLEYFDARRLRQMACVNYALIAAATLTPVVDRLLPWLSGPLALVWPTALFLALLARARRRQQQETDADLRAVALTGDPEALVRGLTGVHAIARIPRRWDARFEKRATHPSLARRIKAIRDAGGGAPAVLGEAAAFSAADGATSVIFRDDRLEWHEGTAAQHTLSYAHITELRLDARRAGTPRLVAVDGTGRRWELPLVDTDIHRAQAVLDVVDVRTASPVVPSFPPMATRWLAVLTAMTALAAGQFGVVVAALVAVLSPERPLVTASAVAALAGGALALRDEPWRSGDATAAVTPLVVAVLGMALLWVARGDRTARAPRHAWRFVTLLGAAAALAWAALLSGGVDVVRLHQSAREWPAAVALSLALAAAAAVIGTRPARLVAGAASLAGLLALGFGSDAFLDRASRDPFVAAAESFRVATISPRRVGEFALPFAVDGFRLSPGGTSVALLADNDDEETVIRVGPIGGPFTAFDADDAVFVDDAQALLLAYKDNAVTITQLAVGATPVVVRQQHLPVSRAGHLSFDRRAGTWTFAGSTGDDRFVRVTGSVVNDGVREERWTLPRSVGSRSATIRSSDRDAMIMETRYEAGLLGSMPWRWTYGLLSSGFRTESRLWTAGPGGAAALAETRLDFRCETDHAADATTVCTAFDGARTRLFLVDPRADRPTAVGSLRGRFFIYSATASDWATGWWDSDPVILRLSTREALRIADPGGGRARTVALADTVVGTLTSDDRRQVLRLYERP